MGSGSLPQGFMVWGSTHRLHVRNEGEEGLLLRAARHRGARLHEHPVLHNRVLRAGGHLGFSCQCERWGSVDGFRHGGQHLP